MIDPVEHVLVWLGGDGLRLVGDLLIPVAAILVPTVIAVRLAQRERLVSEEGERRSRRLQAGAEVLSSLAPFISADPLRHDMHVQLARLRGSIAVYRAWTEKGDFSGDWLSLKHTEGMKKWQAALTQMFEPGRGPLSEDEAFAALDPARRWAADTMESFTGWLSGHIDDAVLKREGAALIETRESGE